MYSVVRRRTRGGAASHRGAGGVAARGCRSAAQRNNTRGAERPPRPLRLGGKKHRRLGKVRNCRRRAVWSGVFIEARPRLRANLCSSSAGLIYCPGGVAHRVGRSLRWKTSRCGGDVAQSSGLSGDATAPRCCCAAMFCIARAELARPTADQTRWAGDDLISPVRPVGSALTLNVRSRAR